MTHQIIQVHVAADERSYHYDGPTRYHIVWAVCCCGVLLHGAISTETHVSTSNRPLSETRLPGETRLPLEAAPRCEHQPRCVEDDPYLCIDWKRTGPRAFPTESERTR